MRILKIKIQNIASLRGEHLIDFDEIMLNDNLFAITGETGSGKSSILNSISMALYGDHFKTNINQADLVTLGESEANIQLIFSVKGKNYLANWSARVRKSNSELLKTPKITREFFEIEAPRFSSEACILDATPEETINLNFDQFSKTIVLNQGEFSKFLTSNFRDRKDILEKLYNNTELEKVGTTLKHKISYLNIEKQNLEHKLEGLQEGINIDEAEFLKVHDKNILKFESFSEFQNMISICEKETNEISKLNKLKIENVDKISINDKSIKKVTQEFNQLKLEKNIIKEELESSQTNYDKRAPELQKSIALVEKRNQLETKTINLEKNITDNTDEFNKCSKLATEIQKKSELTKKNIETTTVKILFQGSLNELEALQKELISLETELNSYEQQILNETKNLIDGEKKNETLQKQVLNHQSAIKNIDHTRVAKSLEDSKNYLELLNNAGKEIELNGQLLLECQQKINHYEIQKKKSKLKLAEDKSNLLEVTDLRDGYLAQLKLQELENAIHICTEKSEIEKKCVVCGNIDISNQLNSKQSSDTNVANLQTKLDNTSIKLDAIKKDVYQLETTTKQNEEHLSEKKQFETKLVEQITKQKNDLNLSAEIALEDLTGNISSLIENTKANVIQLTKKLSSVSETNIQIEQLESYIQDIKSTNLLLDASIKAIELKKQAILKKIKSLADEFKITNINSELLREQTAILHQIENEKKLLMSYNERSEKLKNDINKLSGKIKDDQIVIKDNSKTLNELEVKLQSITAGVDPNKILEQLQQSIKTSRNKFEKHNELIKATEIEYKQLNSKKDILQEQIKEINIKTKQIMNNFNHLNIYHTDIREHQDKVNLIINNITNAPEDFEHIFITNILDEFANINTVVSEELSALRNEITKNETLLAESRKFKELKDSAGKKLKVIKDDLANKNELYTLIGRDEFRNFALSVIEKDLLVQTNHELDQLCNGRYELVHYNKNNRSTPEFYVLDRFKGILERKVSTLSGGETFMVSLAMALALAEMTRGQAEIDSFFIDEGFGSLDEESLDDVFEMINNIKSRGKFIGIISHIKSLTERIPCNIKLNKNQYGESTIDYLYN